MSHTLIAPAGTSGSVAGATAARPPRGETGGTKAAPARGTNLFAGTNDNCVHDQGGSGVFRSTDNGIYWTQVNSGLTDTNVASLYANGTNLFAGTYSGLFRSTNNGTNWVPAGLGLTSTPVCFAGSEGKLFAGTASGVFLSTNSGTIWTPVSTGLVDTAVSCISLDENDLFVLIAGYGIWRRPLSEMVPVELTSFTASANGAEVMLNWSTATELNNQGFEVQRKFSSNDFVTIGSVKGHGTTTSLNNYTYVDKLINAGKYFYRLKQTDFGGKYEYSQTVEVNWSPFTTYKLEQNFPIRGIQ